MIAEEVAEVYPEMVTRNKDGEVEAVMYQFLAPMLLNEVQKQRRTIDHQQKTIDMLQREHQTIEEQQRAIKSLKATVDALEIRLEAVESGDSRRK